MGLWVKMSEMVMNCVEACLNPLRTDDSVFFVSAAAEVCSQGPAGGQRSAEEPATGSS